MTRERFHSLPKMGRYPATRNISGKRPDKVKAFVKKINEELKEVVQLLTQVKKPDQIKNPKERGASPTIPTQVKGKLERTHSINN